MPARAVEEILMTLDELESMRLADLEGLYQEQAAERMAVSRATFGRILEAARRKVAEALIQGKALRIEGGPVSPRQTGHFRCPRCSLEWEGPRPCPRCRAGGTVATHHGREGARRRQAGCRAHPRKENPS
jgi:predicted DNA-binding protein (UPF0251 family)